MRCSRRLSEHLNLRVVHVCAYFAPAFVYGGPPRSILGLCAAQQRAGLDVRVVTTTANGDEELPAHADARYDGDPRPLEFLKRQSAKVA